MSLPLAHIASHATDVGIAPMQAASILSVLLIGSFFARAFVSGPLIEWLDGPRTLFLFSLLQASTLGILPFPEGYWLIYVVAAVFGYGGIAPTYPVIVRTFLPEAWAGRCTGIVILFGTFGMAVGGWVGGVGFDITGACHAPFLLGVAFNLVNLAIVAGHPGAQPDPVSEVRRLRQITALSAVRLVAVVPVGSQVSSADGADAFVPVPVHQGDLVAAPGGGPGETAAAVAADRGEVLLAKRSGLRVLLAEDNRVNQMVTVTLLEQDGYMVDVTANGIEALEAMKRSAHDIILTDSSMPEMGGIEAARHIRRMQGEAANITIIALTADALPGDRERYLEAGMSDDLPKPVRKPDLLAMVVSWVDGAAADRRGSGHIRQVG